MRKRGFLYAVMRAILRLTGIMRLMKPRGVIKKVMCERGKSVCDEDCDRCAWRDDGEVRQL